MVQPDPVAAPGSTPEAPKEKTSSPKKTARDPPSSASPAAEGTTAEERSRGRRRAAFFLDDTEQFAFDFVEDSGHSATAASGPSWLTAEARAKAGEADEEATAQAAEEDKQKELEENTQRVVAAHSESERPLSLEEVQACAAAGLQRGLAALYTFRTTARARHPGHGQQEEAGAGKAAETLQEVFPIFVEGVRRYDESLWRAEKRKRQMQEEAKKGPHYHKQRQHEQPQKKKKL